MNIKNIILIQRDSGLEFELTQMTEMANDHVLCKLQQSGAVAPITIQLNLFHILNALNTPCGAWSLKISPDKYILDNVVFIKAEFIEKEESENGFNLVKVMDGGSRPQELNIKNNRYNQARVRILK
jgi:hypothetical protein